MKRMLLLVIILLMAGAACTQGSQAASSPQVTAECRGTIAFVSDASGRPQIHSMHCDGSDLIQLTTDAHDNYAPAWSPDGTRIAFYKHFSWQSWAIFVMDADGSNPVQITPSDDSILCASAPVWSPDGRQILFMVDSSNQPTCEVKTTDIAVIDADGSDFQLLTDTPAVEFARGWSPDGSHIIYSTMEGNASAIWLMDADGSNPVRLTDASSNNSQPAFSPDGSRIVFVSDRTGSDQVFVMNSDGSEATQLTFEVSDYNMPTWSPDGSQILFTAGNFRSMDVSLFVINADGDGLKQLTDTPGLEYEAHWTATEPTP